MDNKMRNKKDILSYSALEAEVFTKIMKLGFNENPFSLKQEPLFQYSNHYYRPDFVIYKQDKVWALIEVASSLAVGPLFTHAKDRLNQYLFTTGAFFAVITDGKSYLIKKSGDSKNTSDYEEVSEKEFVQRLKGDLQLTKNDSSQKNIRLIIKEIAPDIANSETIQFDSDGNVSFTKSEEQSFFEKILSTNKKTIYRYVSFETLFQTIKNKTYRMLGLAGMNDRTELNYFDNFLGKGSNVDNNIYISSCSLLKDDLTMWRLYGDDGKGVCLAFNVHHTSSCFHLYKVDYGDEPKRHKHLNTIKKLYDNGFIFNDSEIWKHFFKPYEFSTEKEVRLLFIDDFTNKSIGRDWVKTFDNSIINPVIDFPLTESSFPLRLSEIILGPKFPEEELNKDQLNQMLESRGIKEINIEPSAIKCYR